MEIWEQEIVQSFSHIWLFTTPCTSAHQPCLFFTISQSLLKLTYIELVMHPTILSSLILFSSWFQSFQHQPLFKSVFTFSSVQLSHSVVSNSLRIHGLQYTRYPCPSPTPRVYSNSCSLNQWYHSTSVVPFCSHLQSFPASGFFQMSQFFASGGQVLEFQLQHQSFQWIFKADFL